MKFLQKLSLWRRFSIVLALLSLIFLVSGIWSFKALDEFRVGGEDSRRIVAVRDAAADLRATSLHIVDSYLICLELLNADNDSRQNLTERLTALRNQHESRPAALLAQAAASALEGDVLAQVQGTAIAFYSTAFGELLPSLQAGDQPAAMRAMLRMTELYKAHLHAVDHALNLTRELQRGQERKVHERIQQASLLLFIILLLSMSAGLKIVSMIRDSIAYPLQAAIGIADRIAAGDFSARADVHQGQEFDALANAMNQTAQSLERAHAVLQQQAAELEHLAAHDKLTGLPNRALFEERLHQAILQARRDQKELVVMFIDLDKFKFINDSMGRMTGDELLKIVGERMVRCMRSNDAVARMGGDEFIVLLQDQATAANTLLSIVRSIRDAVAQPLQIGEHRVEISCSVGLAKYPEDGEDSVTLLRNADAAMCRAKELGRNNFQFYTAEINAKVRDRLTLHDGLLQAIARNEFVLMYQPQLDLRTRRIVGAEALIRWQRPHTGLVPPMEFIPIAEETGLIVPIGNWVLRTACLQNKAWQDAGMPPVVMSVNVSAIQFLERNLVDQVAQALSEAQLDPCYLALELTESVIMQDVHQAVCKMSELHEMGVELSIDDFGTGYSSLSALKNFPVARLKIDKSFVNEIPGNKDSEKVAAAVVALGHSLRLKVTVEGVETEEQMAFMRQSGCDEVQGYFVSKPLSAAAFEQFMRVSQSTGQWDCAALCDA